MTRARAYKKNDQAWIEQKMSRRPGGGTPFVKGAKAPKKGPPLQAVARHCHFDRQGSQSGPGGERCQL